MFRDLYGELSTHAGAYISSFLASPVLLTLWFYSFFFPFVSCLRALGFLESILIMFAPAIPSLCVQTKKERNKNFKTNLCCQNILGCMVLYWNVTDLPENTHLQKTDSPSASRYQLPIAPWLGVEFHAQFPYLCFLWPGLGLHRFCSYCHQHRYTHVSLWLFYASGSYTLSPSSSSSKMIPESRKGNVA